MDTASEAAAMWGIAENPGFPCQDRLAAALKALNFFAVCDGSIENQSKSPLKRWEYHTVALDPHIRDEELRKILNNLGEDGWELDKIWDNNVMRTMAIFKREAV